jgi:heme exporter protein D
MNGSEFSWSEFFAMGGYAFFVWTSYGITLLVIMLNIVMPVLHRRKVINRVKRAIRREQLQQ